MASNKMLIDASHPEETRVAVVRGNRIEEFDFESQEKQQLRGNIYLAKVTRVEPSLQAAFVDYGGNRHGFLAFSEIHPDYYQIPMADRQALLEQEALEARESREAEDKFEESASDQSDLDEDSEAPDELEADGSAEVEEKPKKRRTRSRRSGKKEKKPAETNEQPEQDAESGSGEQEEANHNTATSDKETDGQDVSGEAEATDQEDPAKPKRRTTRRRTSRKARDSDADAGAASELDLDADESQNDSDDAVEDKPKTVSAAIETASISEPLPEDEGENESDDEPEGSQVTDEDAQDEKPKPRRRTTRRKTAKKAEVGDDEPSPDANAKEENSVGVAEEQANGDNDAVQAGTTEDGDEATDKQETEEKRKPRSRTRRGSRRSKKKTDEDDLENQANGDDASQNGDDADASVVEAVGQEDALEEVPVRRRHRRQYKIQEVVKRRQVMLVQVVKEERGNKGAALTTYLSLAGRYSVLMPNTARGGGISRKITNANDRKRLKSIASELDVPDGMGVILRTAGASRTKAEIKRDFEYLMRLWENVRSTTLSSTAPCLVYEEGNLIKRSIRDLYNKDISEVLVAGDRGFEEAKEFMRMLMPSHAKNVKRYSDSQAMFTRYGVEAHLEKMLAPQVTLKSGGYLVINQTEALVAIDVNSGRATREHSIEETALKTNLEAAEEVARQLRLRDMAGLIVIDFIDMDEKRNNRAVEKRLKDCLKHDRARIQVGRISHFGLLEMSRQRMRSSVLESTMNVCPHCNGLGHVRSESAIALHVFRALEEHVARNNRFDAVLKTTPEIALYILNNKRKSLVDLEARYGIWIEVVADAAIKGQEFVLERGEPTTGPEPVAEAVSYADTTDNDATSDNRSTNEENGDEENERGGRRKRRRRGRKRNDEDRDEVKQADTDSKDETDVEGSTSDASEEDTGDVTEKDEANGDRRKRRRGKRGGKRARNSDDETANDASAKDDIEADTASDVKPSDVGSDAPVTAAEEQHDEASSDTETQTAAIEAVEDESVTNEAAASKSGRNTRRKAVASDTPSEVIVKTVTQEGETQTEAKDAQELEKKKGGWWSRGGGFFG